MITVKIPINNSYGKSGYGKSGYCKISFEVTQFPGCCGACIVHDVTFSGVTHIQHAEIAQKFTDTLLAKSSKQMPSGVRVVHEKASMGPAGYERTEEDKSSRLIVLTHTAKIMMADAVWGENGDTDDLTIYKICMLARGWYQGNTAYNPNSGNDIKMFELTKLWRDDE